VNSFVDCATVTTAECPYHKTNEFSAIFRYLSVSFQLLSVFFGIYHRPFQQKQLEKTLTY